MSVLLIVVPKNNVGLVKTLLVIPSSILKQIFLAFSPVFSPELFAVGGAFMRKKGLLNSGCGQLHMCEFNAEKQNKTKVKGQQKIKTKRKSKASSWLYLVNEHIWYWQSHCYYYSTSKRRCRELEVLCMAKFQGRGFKVFESCRWWIGGAG